MKIKHTIWPSVKHLSAKLRPFLPRSISVKLLETREAEVQQERTTGPNWQGWLTWSTRSMRNTFRITLFHVTHHKPSPCHCVTADNNHCIQCGVADRCVGESYTGYHPPCTHMSNNKLNGSHKSTLSYSWLVTSDSPLMWICSFTKWDLNTEQYSIFLWPCASTLRNLSTFSS